MPTYEENLRDFFGLDWEHGYADVPYEFVLLYTRNDREEALCQFGVEQGLCYGSGREFTLFSKHHETLNNYRKEHQDFYKDKISSRHMYL